MQLSPKVDTYISSKSLGQQPLFEACRQLIMESSPKIVEEIKWNIPFYSYYGMLCYLSPHKSGLLWGFCSGASLSDEFGLFQGKDRKMIRHISITDTNQVYEEGVRLTLQEALLYNEELKKNANN